MSLLVEPGFSFPPAFWIWGKHCTVVVLQIHLQKSTGGLGKSNDASVAFGRKMHLAGGHCLPIADTSLRKPLGHTQSNKVTRRT